MREKKRKFISNSCLKVFRLGWALESTPSVLQVARSDNLN